MIANMLVNISRHYMSIINTQKHWLTTSHARQPVAPSAVHVMGDIFCRMFLFLRDGPRAQGYLRPPAEVAGDT